MQYIAIFLFLLIIVLKDLSILAHSKVVFLIKAALWSGTRKFLLCHSNIISLLYLKLFLFCGLTLCYFMDNKSYLHFINIQHLIKKSSSNQDLDSYHRLWSELPFLFPGSLKLLFQQIFKESVPHLFPSCNVSLGIIKPCNFHVVVHCLPFMHSLVSQRTVPSSCHPGNFSFRL